METTMKGWRTCSDRASTGALDAMNSGQAFRQNGRSKEVAKLQMELVA